MAIFAIIHQPGVPAERLAEVIKEKFPNANLDIEKGSWLVYGLNTAKEVSELLGITTDPTVGAAVVLEVGSYFGRANPAIWSWIKNNWEAKLAS